jgi:hypothetical protein
MYLYVLALSLDGREALNAIDVFLRAEIGAEMVFPGAWLIPWSRTCRDLHDRTRTLLPGRSFLLSQVENGWALSQA